MPDEFPAVTEKPSISGCSTFSPASDSIELPRRGFSSSANVIAVPSAWGPPTGRFSPWNLPGRGVGLGEPLLVILGRLARGEGLALLHDRSGGQRLHAARQDGVAHSGCDLPRPD